MSIRCARGRAAWRGEEAKRADDCGRAFIAGAANLHGDELGALYGASARLQGGVERAQRLEVVAEELGAHWCCVVWRPCVKHSAAHGELSRRLNLRRTFVPRGKKARLKVGKCRRIFCCFWKGEMDCRRGHGSGGGNWRCEGGGGGHDHERMRTQMVRAKGCCCLEARCRCGAVVFDRRRKLENAREGGASLGRRHEG